jgi:hypothetical protein
MIGTRAVSLILLCLAIVSRQDPQAAAIAQAVLTAMGGAQAIAGYQDYRAAGTLALSAGGNPVLYPITVKSKGLWETRTEIPMPKGTNIRIRLTSSNLRSVDGEELLPLYRTRFRSSS